MANRIKYGNVVLCEHAIRGEGNKHSLIGVFSGDLIVPAFPANLNFGLFVELLDTHQLRGVALALSFNDKVFGRLSASFDGGPPDVPGIILVPLIPMGVEEAGTLKITVKAEGFVRTTLAEKRIIGATSPIA